MFSRRATLALLVAAGLLAGCALAPPGVTGTPPPADLAAEDATVERGGSAVVVLTASHVGELHVTARPLTDEVAFDYGNATFSTPSPISVQTLPPYWVWDAVQRTATVRLPVHASADAATGPHRFSAVAWNDTDHNHENGTTDAFVVRVVNGTTD